MSYVYNPFTDNLDRIIPASVLPPAVATSYQTDGGTAVPAANILRVLGDSTSDNDEDGIRTTGATNVVTVQLTNRIFGGATTLPSGSAIAATLTLPAVSGVYTFEVKVAGYEATTPAGIGFSLFAAVISDGVTATKIGVTDKIKNAQAALAVADADILVSGNTVEVEVTGVALLNISWTVVGTYVQGVV